MAKPTENRSRPRARRSPEELRRVVLLAAEAEFKASGFAGATTAAIARRAATTEAQIFRYFPTKADLFREAMLRPLDRHLQEFMASTFKAGDGAPPLERQAGNYISELQDFITEHQRMFLSLIMADAGASDGVDGIGGVDALSEYFARGASIMRSRSGGEAKIPPELMVRISFAAVLGCTIFEDWLYPDGLADAAEIRGAVARFVIDGLYSEPVDAG